MSKQLYIDNWNNSNAKIQINNAISNRYTALNGLTSIELPDNKSHTVPALLAMAMGFGKGSETSWYQLFIPPSNDRVIKVRISDHLSSPSEWPPIEDSLPNKRYSIVFFNRHSMNIQYKQGVKYIDWNTYTVEGIDVCELVIYCGFVQQLWIFIYKALLCLYNGGKPEDNKLTDYIARIEADKRMSSNDIISQWNRTIDKNNESKTNKNMKKNVVKINENTLRQIVAESVKKVLREGILSGGHGEAIRQTYNTVGELMNMWSGICGGDGKYTEVGDRITSALYNVIKTIEQIDRDALDDDEESGFSPYGLKPFSR